jgi:transcriptional regulator with XRE-family HTH domain
MNLNDQLKAYRSTRNITQIQIAKKLDVTQAYISTIENNSVASVAQIKRVVEGLGGTLLIQATNSGLSPSARAFIETSGKTPAEMIKVAKAFNSDITFKIK